MMEDMAGRIMVRAAMKAPYLERDEEHRLAVRWKEDNDQNALALHHRRRICGWSSPWPPASAISACRWAT